jgi:hypothetical protein
MRAMPQKPVTPAIIKPAPTNAGTTKNQGDTSRPSIVPKNARLPALDLHLPQQLDRLTAVSHDGEPRLSPGVEATFDDEGFAGLTCFLGEPGGMLRRACAAPAMKDDGAAVVHGHRVRCRVRRF